MNVESKWGSDFSSAERDWRKRKADEKMRKAELFKAQDGAQEEQLLPATPVKLYTYWKKGKWIKDLVAHASDMVTYVDDVVESMSSGSWCVDKPELNDDGSVTLFNLDDEEDDERRMYEQDVDNLATGED